MGKAAKSAARMRKGGGSGEGNRFEQQISRQKFEVLGQKKTHSRGRPGESRLKAQQKRKETLVKELHKQHSANAFVDRRFGEADATLSVEDKMFKRMERERLKRMKRSASAFNLEEPDTGEVVQLTHKGKSLDALDGDEYLPSEDEFEGVDDAELDPEERRRKRGEIGGAQTGGTHFGGGLFERAAEGPGEGGEGREGGHKTSREMYAELVSQSKKEKAQRRLERIKEEDMIADVDAEFHSLKAMLEHKPKQRTMEEIARSLEQPREKPREEDGVGNGAPKRQREEADDYDIALRQLVHDRRAEATDRAKTDEEIAIEEKIRLDRLEQDRLKRMRGDVDQDTLLAEGDLGTLLVDKTDKRAVMRARRNKELARDHPDALGSDDEEYLKEMVDDDESDDDSDGEDGEDGEDDMDDEEESADEMDSDQDIYDDDDDDDDDDDGDDDGDDGGDGDDDAPMEDVEELKRERKKLVSAVRERKLKIMEKARQELPYAIEAPKSYNEFVVLVTDRSVEELETAISRILTYNHIKFAAENRDKLEKFHAILLQYFLSLASAPEHIDVAAINVVVAALGQMPDTLGEPLVGQYKQRIGEIAKTLNSKLQKRFKASHSTWPSPDSLLLFQLVSSVFPTTDYRHPIVTPAMLLMQQCLSQCSVTNRRQATRGVFVATTLLAHVAPSRRYVPEVMLFLLSLLAAHIPAHTAAEPFRTPLFTAAAFAVASDAGTAGAPQPLSLQLIADKAPAALFASNQHLVDLLGAAMALLETAADVWDDNMALPEIFGPAVGLLEAIGESSSKTTPKALRTVARKTRKALADKIDGSAGKRWPLTWQKQKPKLIATYNPKFKEDDYRGRNTDPDKERRAYQQLKREHKRELKSAIRELKKDSMAIQAERQREARENLAERESKLREVNALLNETAHTYNAAQEARQKMVGGKKKRK